MADGVTPSESVSDDRLTALFDAADRTEPLEEMRLLAEIQQGLFGRFSGPFTLDRYVIIDPIGRGSAGVVYRAYDPDLGRAVALKVVNPRARKSLSDSELRFRLAREAQAMARISHPNVVTVHDVGLYDLTDNQPDVAPHLSPRGVFVVMELIGGQDLGRWLAERERPWKEITSVFLAAGRGLEAAHAQEIVHHDFKPANVIVGSDGRVCVADFGLARVAIGKSENIRSPAPADTGVSAQANERLGSRLTKSGTIMGTPSYMAPEQHRGYRGDKQSDQYAYCAALWEGLFGGSPFEGRTLAELAEAKEAARVTEPPRDATVPGWLRAILLRGLEPDPGRRHASMTALLAAIDRRLHARRRWAPVLVSTAALSMWTAGMLWSVSHDDGCADQSDQLIGIWDPEVRARVERAFLATDRPFAADAWVVVERDIDAYTIAWSTQRTTSCQRMLGGNAYGMEAVGPDPLCLERRRTRLGELTSLLATADATMVEQAVEATRALPPIESCTAPSEESVPDDPELARAIEGQLARAETLRDLGRYHDAVAAAKRALEQALQSGHGTSQARALEQFGTLLGEVGSHDEAMDHLQQGIWTAERTGNDSLAIAGMLELSRLLSVRMSRHQEGELLARIAAARLQFRGLEDELDARAALQLGQILTARGRYDEAERALDRALELARLVHGEDDLPAAQVLNARGNLFRALGRDDDTLEAYRAALAIREAILGDAHPDVGGALNNVANVLMDKGDLALALSMYLRVLANHSAALGPDHPRVATVHNNVGIVLQRLNRFEEARAHFEQALELRTQHFGEQSLPVAVVHLNLGSLQSDTGTAEQALGSYTRALEIRTRLLAEDHPGVAAALSGTGFALHLLGDYDLALERHQRALEIRESRFGAHHPDVAMSLKGLGAALDELGGHHEAVLLLKRAVDMRAEILGPSHHATALARIDLGQALHRSGRSTEGLIELESAIGDFERESTTGSPDLVQALLVAARIQLSEGQTVSARERLEQALRIAEHVPIRPSLAAEVRRVLARSLPASERARILTLENEAEALPKTSAPPPSAQLPSP